MLQLGLLFTPIVHIRIQPISILHLLLIINYIVISGLQYNWQQGMILLYKSKYGVAKPRHTIIITNN